MTNEMLPKATPYVAIISLQFGYSGMYIVIAICFIHGMNHFILSVNRHIFATLVIAPFSLTFERYPHLLGLFNLLFLCLPEDELILNDELCNVIFVYMKTMMR